MNAPSEDIKDILAAESSLGLTFATDLFYGREPDGAGYKNTVTIFDTSGRPPALTLEEEGAGLDYCSVQIRVRNTDYDVGWVLIQDIRDALHGRAQETWNGTLYTVIYCLSGPALLDWDENNRVRFIVNFNMIRR